MIADDPTKGLASNNIIIKIPGERCKHLIGNKPGEFSCAVHNYPWYKKTMCHKYGGKRTGGRRINNKEDICETGKRVMDVLKKGEIK
jgi:hypothetical protein